MKKLLVSLLVLCLLAGCGAPINTATPPTAQDTNQVIVAISTEPETGFDPTLGWGHGSTPLVQSTLVEYTQDMQIKPDLALAYTISPNGLEWRFTLRKDAFFTDGEPVKASDVAYTFLTAKNSQTSLDLTFLQNCTAEDDHTVLFHLSAPTSTFLNTIASVGIVPQHAHGPDYANHPIGSGPWVLEEWNKGEQIILSANQNYYGTPPAIQKATLVFMDEDAAFAAALAGQVDVALTSATHATQNIPGMRLQAVTTVDNRGLTLPTQPNDSRFTASGFSIGNDVTSNLSIRQALAYGIDRQKLADDALNGFGDPAYSENDGMPWNNPATKLETDVQKAKNLLAQDGWADTDNDGIVERNGLKAEFRCLYPSGDSVRQAIAMAAAAQAAQLGISILVEGVSWDEISKNMFSCAVLMGWGSTNPYTSYLLYHSANALRDDYYNPEGFSNAATDVYLDDALHATTQEEANALWQKAQWDGENGTAMQGDCPWVWLVNIQHIYYVKDGLNIGLQQLHAHGSSWPLVQNLRDWKWI